MPDFYSLYKSPLMTLQGETHEDSLYIVVPELNHVKITFTKLLNDHSLNITIETPRLLMHSIGHSSFSREDDLENLVELFSNPEVMEKFEWGTTLGYVEVEQKYTAHKEGFRNGNPYGGFCVYQKEEDVFVGFAVLCQNEKRGTAEFAIVLALSQWQQRFGTEISLHMIYHYAAKLYREGYTLEDNAPLEEVMATARTDNYTPHIFQKLKMTTEAPCMIYNAERTTHRKSIEGIERILEQTADITPNLA